MNNHQPAAGPKPGALAAFEARLNQMYRKRETLLAVAGLFAVVLFAALDYTTRYRIDFSVLYLIPIFVATLYVRKQAGIVIALSAALVWVLTDFLTSHGTPDPELADWNVVIRVAFFALIAFSLIALKRDLETERRLSRVDSLTGIANVRAFNDFLQIPRHRPISVAYLDCDNFKAVNDSRGHLEGDRLLQLIAKTIRFNLRAGDLVARLGGDEFVVVLTEVDPLTVEEAVERLKKLLLDEIHAAGFAMTFSIGVVTYTEPQTAAHHLIKEADALMYSVKKSTKNDIAFRTADDRRHPR